MPPFPFGGPSISDPEANLHQERTARLRDGSIITIPAGMSQEQTLDAIFEAEANKGLVPKHRLSPELAQLVGVSPDFEIDPLVARDRLTPLMSQGLTPAIGQDGVTTWGYTKAVMPDKGDKFFDKLVDAIGRPFDPWMSTFVNSLENVIEAPGKANFGDYLSTIAIPPLLLGGAAVAGPTMAGNALLDVTGDELGSRDLVNALVNPVGTAKRKGIDFAGDLVGDVAGDKGELVTEALLSLAAKQRTPEQDKPIFGPSEQQPPLSGPPPLEKDMGLLDDLAKRFPPTIGPKVGTVADMLLPTLPGVGITTPGIGDKQKEVFDLNRLKVPGNIGDVLDFKIPPDLNGLGVSMPTFGLDLLKGLGIGGIGDDLGFWGGGVSLPPTPPGPEPGILSKIGGAIGNFSKGVVGGLGGLGDWLRGAVGGGGGQQQGQQAGGINPNLALLIGAGLTSAGLAQKHDTPDFESLFAGAPGQSRGIIDAQAAAEQARRQQAEEQYLGRRDTALRTLEDILGQGTQRAMERGIQTQQERLNRQGLLDGPSGALNEAVARVAGDVRQAQLPALVDFARQTETGLEGLRGSGLAGDIALGRVGTERQLGLTDQQRSATLRQRLLASERKNQQRSSLLRTGSEAIGYGLGGTSGAGLGNVLGRRLEDILD